MTRHSLGAVLTSARKILMAGVDPAEVLQDVDVPAWYLAELERDHVDRPNDDLLTLIYQTYELTDLMVQDLRAAPQLTIAVQQLATRREQATATYHRQQRLSWPDSACASFRNVSASKSRKGGADLLRCLRTQIDHVSVAVAARDYHLSPMAYWQMEAAQLATTAAVDKHLRYRLEVDDLRQFIDADDLLGLLCRQLNIGQPDKTWSRVPGKCGEH